MKTSDDTVAVKLALWLESQRYDLCTIPVDDQESIKEAIRRLNSVKVVIQNLLQYFEEHIVEKIIALPPHAPNGSIHNIQAWINAINDTSRLVGLDENCKKLYYQATSTPAIADSEVVLTMPDFHKQRTFQLLRLLKNGTHEHL